MLIYCSRFWFGGQMELAQPLGVVAGWLGRKVQRDVTTNSLIAGTTAAFRGGHEIRSVVLMDEYPHLATVTYRHPDKSIKGREWITEIGFRQVSAGEAVECTILLKTAEMSARVAMDVVVTRPGIVTDLVNRCPLGPQTVGLKVVELGDTDAFRYGEKAWDPARRHPLVVLSADGSGAYNADARRLSSNLVGLAEVIVLTPSADAFLLPDVVGAELVPYLGAVRVLFPSVQRDSATIVPSKLFTPVAVQELKAIGRDVESEILSIIVHRSNVSLSRSHISPEFVQGVVAKRLTSQKREAAKLSGDAHDYVAYLEGRGSELELKADELQTTIRSLQNEAADQEDRFRELRYSFDAIKDRLNQAGLNDPDTEQAAEGAAAISESLQRAVIGKLLPEDCLRILTFLYKDRVVVLPSAVASARESKGFELTPRLYELLMTLMTDYWDALASGKPDAEARQVFGNAYAAKESETVERKKEARERRTFEYRGTPLLMQKHLKIGVKDSAAKTIRVHFEWIAAEARIVIGYCGPHIPFK